MLLVHSPRFLRSYKKLPLAIRKQTEEHIHLLELDPHHPSLRTHKRQGEKNVWQARISRDYRLYFLMEGEIITLLDVGPHEK